MVCFLDLSRSESEILVLVRPCALYTTTVTVHHNSYRTHQPGIKAPVTKHDNLCKDTSTLFETSTLKNLFRIKFG